MPKAGAPAARPKAGAPPAPAAGSGGEDAASAPAPATDSGDDAAAAPAPGGQQRTALIAGLVAAALVAAFFYFR